MRTHLLGTVCDVLATTDGAEDPPVRTSEDDAEDDAIEIDAVWSAEPGTAHAAVRRVGPAVHVAIGYGLPIGIVAQVSSDLDRTDDLTAVVDARVGAPGWDVGGKSGILLAAIEPSVVRIATCGEHVVAVISDEERTPRALTHLDRRSTRPISAGLVAGSTLVLSAGRRPIPPFMLAQRHLTTSALADSVASIFGPGEDHAVVVARCLREGG
jgi:hypothetical protein